MEKNVFDAVARDYERIHNRSLPPGVHSADFNWFAPWKSIDGREVEPNTTGSMKTLVEGLFPKERLLNYIRHFLVHEEVNEVITKKGAKYHQFFAVNFAVQEVLRAMQPEADKHHLVPENGRGDQEPGPHPAGIEARQQDGSTDKERDRPQACSQGPTASE